MCHYEIDYGYMKVKASDNEIVNEIITRLRKKGAGGITLENNKIGFSGGILCGIVLSGSLLCGLTSGKIGVKDNKIRYSLSFLETYIMTIIGILFFIGVYSSENGFSPVLIIVPLIFIGIVIIFSRSFGSGKFKQFLETCILKADEKARR